MSETLDPVVSAGEGATNPADVTEKPEVVNPETVVDESGEEKKPDAQKETDAERENKKLKRALDRNVAQKHEARAKAQLLEQRLAEIEQKLDGSGDDREATAKPADIERLANEKAQELVRRQRVAAKVESVLKAGEKFEDFSRAADELAQEVPFTDSRGNPSPFIEAILDADNPAMVIHYLGNNPEEAAEFAELTPAQQGRRIAKLETKLAAEAKTKISAAPKPLTPTTGSAVSERDQSKMSDAEWYRWSLEQDRRKKAKG